MRILFSFLLFFTLVISLPVSAQSTLFFSSPDFYYKTGISLINENKFGAAKEAFITYQEKGTDKEYLDNAAYYIAYCSIQLEHNDAELLVEQFIIEHPAHPKSQTAYFELGNLKYDRKQYDDAIRYYQKVYLPDLPKDQEAEARFKMGYAYFTQKKFDEAYEQFNELKKKDNPFKYASNYYSGYINFQKGEYDRAYYDFIRAEENDYYATIVPELINKTLYKQKKYDEVIRYSTKQLNKKNVKNASEFYLYLAEAYYKKEDFDNSAKNFDKYMEATRKSPNPEVMFRIADARQRAGDDEGAIEGFKKAALLNNELGQIASFYLGNLYIKTENTSLAPAAFKTASDKAYNKDIQKKALYLLAKVNYDLGNYSVSITRFNEYLEKYPNETSNQELNELLTDAYFRTNNYDDAIKHFDKIAVKSTKVKRAYQMITFNEGSRLFNEGNYHQAIDLFEKSTEFPEERDILIKANYWKGETYYLLNQFNDARNSYASVFRLDNSGQTEEYLKSRYSIGYIYYNEKDYQRALTHFKYYVENGKNTLNYPDAVTRLADCYYTTKDYDMALATYSVLVSNRAQNSDYAHYQQGEILGINGNVTAANNQFDQVINNYPRSVYVDDAIFHRAQFNFENGEYAVAVNGFNHLINAYQNSPFVPFALQSRALAHANLGEHSQAANDYKQILNKYPNHSTSENALLGLQQELSALGQSDQFSKFLSEYKKANPDKNNLENIEFESAKTLYYDQKYSQAIQSFNSYLSSYPYSSNKNDALYFLGDSYQRNGQPEQAIQTFDQLVGQKTYSRYARVIEKLSDLKLNAKDFKGAINYLRILESVSSNKKSQYKAWSGMMHSYYNLQKFDSSDYYANVILEKGLVTTNAENMALLYLGKSAYQRKFYEAATDYFLTALNSAKDEYGAEAQYLLAKIYYEQKQYQTSLEALFNLTKTFSMYDLWVSKAYLLMADNYIAMEEYFQAKATLESIVQYATITEVVEEAKQKLESIKEQTEDTSSVPDTLEIVNPE